MVAGDVVLWQSPYLGCMKLWVQSPPPHKAGMMITSVTPAFGRERQEDPKVKVILRSLGILRYMSPCLKQQQQQQQKTVDIMYGFCGLDN